MAYINRKADARKGRANNRQNNTNNRGTIRDVIRSKAPECFDLAQFIRNSASLRRHVSLAIKAQLLKSGAITDTDKVFVEFELSHYTVNVNGLGQDYRYSNLTLLRAVLASCISVTTQMQEIVNEVCVAEYEDILTEVSDLSSKDAQAEIMSISDAVLEHIHTHKAED